MAASRLNQLRELMRQHSPLLDALLVPTTDAHQSEYVSERDSRRAFLTGFTGSAGEALVTLDKAFLFVDGRYHLQADQQVDAAQWTVMKQGLPSVPTLDDHLASLPSSSSAASSVFRIGFDPMLMSQNAHERITKRLASVANVELQRTAGNLVDRVWGEERPNPTPRPAMVQPLEYAGVAVADKVSSVREALRDKASHAVVLSALDEVAWLLNVRGWDVHCNPVVVSYVVVTASQLVWYVDSSRLADSDVTAHLQANGITVRPYDAVYSDLAQPSSLLFADRSQQQAPLRVIAEKASSNVAIQTSLEQNPLTEMTSASLIALPKALKNPVELEGMRSAHVKDGVALVSFLAWLHSELVSSPSSSSSSSSSTAWTEYTASERLDEFRSRQKGFVSPSFDTIFGSGSNGAIIHYKPERETAAPVTADTVLLIDSGGQYRDGTTDVTRTIYFPSPSAASGAPSFVVHAFTRVLQGHIALATAVFPKGTTGYQLDILARRPLWSSGLDYLHGTGHGVGSFLNVHEGPHGISFRLSSNDVPLQPGMVVTNEPGYYQKGQFGIRIESVLVVKHVDFPHGFNDREYYGFETITMTPIQLALVDLTLLSPDELKWLTDYNQRVADVLGPHLSEAENKWMHDHATHHQ